MGSYIVTYLLYCFILCVETLGLIYMSTLNSAAHEWLVPVTSTNAVKFSSTVRLSCTQKYTTLHSPVNCYSKELSFDPKTAHLAAMRFDAHDAYHCNDGMNSIIIIYFKHFQLVVELPRDVNLNYFIATHPHILAIVIICIAMTWLRSWYMIETCATLFHYVI